MNTTIKSVHFDIDTPTREWVQQKADKLQFAQDKIVDLDFTFTKIKDHSFEVEAKIHFRWGVHTVVKLESYDLAQGIERLIDKLDKKVRKEVDKITDHKA